MFKASSTFLTLVTAIVAFTPSILCHNNHYKWLDTTVKAPKDFHAFPTYQTTTSNGCYVEIIFSRDMNDQTWQYDVYGIFENGKTLFLKPEIPKDPLSSLAYVNATPIGQRGAYSLNDSYTLTPIILNICDLGKDDPNFPEEFKGKTPTEFRLQAIHAGVKHADETYWYSRDFKIEPNNVTPRKDDVKYVWASVQHGPEGQNQKKVDVGWKGPEDISNVQGYFILVGPHQNAKKIQSFFFPATQSTATIQVGYYTDNYDVSVIMLNKAGGLTPFDKASRVPILENNSPIKHE